MPTDEYLTRTSDGVYLRLRRKRGGARAGAPAVILVPGFGQNCNALDLGERSLAGYLVREGFDVFLCDLRGHGPRVESQGFVIGLDGVGHLATQVGSTMIIESTDQLDSIDFAKGDGLVPLIVQHADTGGLRMLGYADREALQRTLATGFVHFFSRSRGALWKKGETSGNTLALVSLHVDCDHDAALALVTAAGPTCHTGAETCFEAPPFLERLATVIDDRAAAAAAGEAERCRRCSEEDPRWEPHGE